MNIPREEESIVGTASLYNYKYQGQELQETGFYSFKWRNYMPDVGRFFNVDPLAEKMPSWSPYNYTFKNPVNFVDPDGREPDDWYRDNKGNVSWHDSQANSIKGNNGETLSRLGKSGSYQNANGGVTTLNKNRSVTQDGVSSIAAVPRQMSGLALNQHKGGETFSSPGSNTNFVSFDTTVYHEGPSKTIRHNGSIMDPSASLFKAYVEAQADGYLLKGLGSILSTESIVLESSVSNVMGRSYKAVGEVTVPIKILV